MKTKKKKLYIFDVNGTLYHDTEVKKEFEETYPKYVAQKLLLPIEQVIPMLESAKLKYLDFSTTIACTKEFNLDFNDFVSNTYMKLDLGAITLNRNVLKYLYDVSIDRVVFTSTPRRYAERILESLKVSDFFREIVGMEDIKFQPKNKSSFRLVSEKFVAAGYDEIYFWDNMPENRELGLRVGWIPMMP